MIMMRMRNNNGSSMFLLFVVVASSCCCLTSVTAMNASPEPFEHEQCIKWEEDTPNNNVEDNINERPQFPQFTGFNLRGSSTSSSSNQEEDIDGFDEDALFYNGIGVGNNDRVPVIGSNYVSSKRRARRNCILKKKILLRKHGNAIYHWITDMEGTQLC